MIEPNRILTNAHNVSNLKYVEIRKQNSAKRYVAHIEFVAHDCDLAILQVDDKSFYDDTEELQIGPIPQINTTVNTYGYPMGGSRLSVTKGVVSRIQIDSYAHPAADGHLVIQTDAAINPGNSGGPVIQDSNVVGVAFQGLTTADNIGYMIPATVINHFLADIEDGTYDGFGSLGVVLFAGLHNDLYRQYLEVPADKQGIVVLCGQRGIIEHGHHIGDIGNVPVGDVLIKRVCRAEHATHISYTGSIPGRDVLVKSVCPRKHPTHISHTGSIPGRVVLVEGVCIKEHVSHICNIRSIPG